MSKVYQVFAAALAEHGVDTVFGLMGDANLHYIAVYRDGGGRFVPVVHEGGAVGMADAYARVSGRLGVASVTHGPALTNTLTFLVEAARSRTPLLLLTGDTPEEPLHFQRVDIPGFATTAGAGFERVHNPSTVVRDLNRACQRAVAERRPVVLDLPYDLLTQDAGGQLAVRRPVSTAAAAPDADAVDRAVRLLTSAHRPIVLAGRGAVAAGARAELVGLADRVGAPLATTMLGKDYFAGEPANLGVFGGLSDRLAGTTIVRSDCVIAFGAGLNGWTTFEGGLTQGKRIIHVDADPAALGAHTQVDAPVVGDARLVAAALNAALDNAGHRADRTWRAGIEAAVAARTPHADVGDGSGPDTVDIRSAMIRLDELLPRERTLVSDIGRFLVGTWPYLHVTRPEKFVIMGAFGSIGLGMAGAIGATVATPGQLGVAVFGDGGFMMHLAEFTTAVRQELPIVVVVLNDGAYGAEHFKLSAWGMNPDYTLNTWPDLAELARAMGGDGLTVRTLTDLDAVPRIVAGLTGPVLLDVRIDPHVDLAAEIATGQKLQNWIAHAADSEE